MLFIAAEDPEAAALRAVLEERAFDTGAPCLMTANLWLWAAVPPESDPQAALSALFAAPNLPCRELLEPRAATGPWVGLSQAGARAAVIRLLTAGASVEVAAFADDPGAAIQFADRLLQWIGSPLAAFANMEYQANGRGAGFGVFRVPHWVNEGLVLISPVRAGLVWFAGTD